MTSKVTENIQLNKILDQFMEDIGEFLKVKDAEKLLLPIAYIYLSKAYDAGKTEADKDLWWQEVKKRVIKHSKQKNLNFERNKKDLGD